MVHEVRVAVAGFGKMGMLHAALRQAEDTAQPGLLYLHPHDMDADWLRLPARWYFKLMRYDRLGRTEAVLRRLLGASRFTSIRDWLVARPADGGSA